MCEDAVKARTWINQQAIATACAHWNTQQKGPKVIKTQAKSRLFGECPHYLYTKGGHPTATRGAARPQNNTISAPEGSARSCCTLLVACLLRRTTKSR
ncbi:hypothetical protein EVAR_40783_1 [Eumeta japonica]|uniref:Uncharacterized protein n=1 Tax=Eumeta variegata TaxID=151549 RepID=A0A4C1X6E4_EUMVA|nr:hypothetical protein EVAR_40783_1 [Eumeta japonica]